MQYITVGQNGLQEHMMPLNNKLLPLDLDSGRLFGSGVQMLPLFQMQFKYILNYKKN
jgi:hypothetical protein